MFLFKKKPEAQLNDGTQGQLERKRDYNDCCYFVGYAVSDVGRVRENNEDNYILGLQLNRESADHSETALAIEAGQNKWYFAGVFDGMGGGDKGVVAARITAETFCGLIRKLPGNASREQTDKVVRNAFLKSNNAIVEMQKRYKVYGTTGTVVGIRSGQFKIYHLGDSRAYFLRDGKVTQLTRDQTLAQLKIDTGIYNRDHPGVQTDKHKLTEYIGRDWTRENIRPVESEWMTVRAGDRLLLCSDGLYDMCSDEQIAGHLGAGSNASAAAKALNQDALCSGGADNVTCIVIMFS